MTEKELHKVFSVNIREYRTRNHWTQLQLAKKTGVSSNFINDIEVSKKWASPATMVKIANVFGIEVYELLKPPGLFPDNLSGILRKYADDIYSALEQTRDVFLQNEENLRKKETKKV